jgi:hypothetical protein
MTEDELIERMARAAEPAAHGPAWELAKEAQRRALAAIREAGCEVVPREPTPDQLTAAGTITGWNEAAPKNADECHVEGWIAMLSASPLKGET